MSITIAAMGDTLCRSKDGSDPFAHVRDVWVEADVRFLNLETVLTNRGTPAPKRTLLRTDPREVKWLEGFDVVHTANNHAFDYGEQGCRDTLRTLYKSGIQSIGAGGHMQAWAPASINRFGLGFLGFHAYPMGAGSHQVAHLENRERVLRSVSRISEMVDALVVSLHWGAEHAPHPSPAQIELAHAIVDAGACLVLGHGPHRVQAFERYKHGLIAYSLGNFNFWHTDIEETEFTRLGVILLAEMDETGVTDFELTPVWIDVNGAPRPGEGCSKTLSLAYFDNLCRNLDVTWSQWYEEIGATYVTQSLKSFAVTIPRHGWVRVKKLLWWLGQAHTWRAIAGMIREWLK